MTVDLELLPEPHRSVMYYLRSKQAIGIVQYAYVSGDYPLAAVILVTYKKMWEQVIRPEIMLLLPRFWTMELESEIASRLAPPLRQVYRYVIKLEEKHV